MVNKAFKLGYTEALNGIYRLTDPLDDDDYCWGVVYATAFHPDKFGKLASKRCYKAIREKALNNIEE